MAGLTPFDPTLNNIGLQIAAPFDPSGITIGFTGIPGNQPAKYQNSVALWDSFAPVFSGPNASTPLVTVPITSDLQPSNIRIPWNFTGSDYLVTYQTLPLPAGGGNPTGMCAALQLSPRLAATIEPPANISLEVYSMDATSITLIYSVLQGYLPQSGGNWVGIWQGFAGPYFAPAPLASASISGDSTQGLVTISNLTLIPSFVYRVIYFMGPPTGVPGSNIGAMLTFQAMSSPSG